MLKEVVLLLHGKDHLLPFRFPLTCLPLAVLSLIILSPSDGLELLNFDIASLFDNLGYMPVPYNAPNLGHMSVPLLQRLRVLQCHSLPG